MAIDADLNAGLITDDEARERREKIASRRPTSTARWTAPRSSCKGDAIAGVIIVADQHGRRHRASASLQQGMSLRARPSQHYTLLTVGDGLVAQIPALLISTATGIIVTRSASARRTSASDIARQLAQPAAAALPSPAASSAAWAWCPGLPKLPVLRHRRRHLAAWPSRCSSAAARRRPRSEAADAEATAVATRPAEPENGTQRCSALDPLELEIGYGLVPLVDADEGGDLLEPRRADPPPDGHRARPRRSPRSASATTSSSARTTTRASSAASRWRAGRSCPAASSR